jgi:hypothetical protein
MASPISTVAKKMTRVRANGGVPSVRGGFIAIHHGPHWEPRQACKNHVKTIQGAAMDKLALFP